MRSFSVGYYFPAHPEQAQPAARGAINAISQGLVDIRTQIFPLAEAAAAQSGQVTVGKSAMRLAADWPFPMALAAVIFRSLSGFGA